MRNQIRVPKAKKINSYNILNSDLTKNHKDSIQVLSTKPVSFEKNRSEENLRKCNLEDEHICFEVFESDINDQMKKLSAFNEITNIVNNLNEFLNKNTINSLTTKTRIVRSENPFNKNFENRDTKKELPRLSKMNSKDSTDDEEEEQPRNTKLFSDSSSLGSNLEIVTDYQF
jgi:hypothetical protein